MRFTLTKDWWKSATGYQIYPRSFADSNGDGVGDIPGIIARLDYLRDLGIGFIWLSPVYRSPMRDNGYDISDYCDIAPEFGTLADMDRLIAEAAARGIGIVMDLVVNHSSDEHAWFQNARSSRGAEFRDFYIWRDPGPDGGAPNDLKSYFGGSAWQLDDETGQYYLHLFDAKQPDLNWQNPSLRREIYQMMNWWLDRGIAGFRMDVIDLIGKEPDAGITADGPGLHALIQEMHTATYAGRNVVTVGETWSARLDNAALYCGRDRNELSMVFQFSHISQGWDAEFGRYRASPTDLVALKRCFNDWQAALAEDGWNSLFWSNHDLPRAVSRYGDDGAHRVASAKALGLVLHLMKGTPYIYQGEEIGMTNSHFAAISEFNDVEIHGQWPMLQAKGLSEAEFLEGANQNARDHARTPIQWSDAPQAGFTTGMPWLPVNPNYLQINVTSAEADPDSILAFYRRMTRLRQDLPLLCEGGFTPLFADHPQVWAYLRGSAKDRLLVIANLSGETAQLSMPDGIFPCAPLLSNGVAGIDLGATTSLPPWAACVARLR